MYSINVYILLLIIFHSYVKYIRFILAFVLCVPPNLLWCIDPVQFTLAAFNKIFFKYTRSSQVILDISTCQWQAQTNTNWLIGVSTVFSPVSSQWNTSDIRCGLFQISKNQRWKSTTLRPPPTTTTAMKRRWCFVIGIAPSLFSNLHSYQHPPAPTLIINL